MLQSIVHRYLVLAAMAAAIFFQTGPARAEFKSPDILVLGDSQLSFGAGVAFMDLLGDIKGQCGLSQRLSVGVLGVRSSQLVAWTAKDAVGKKSICDIDPKWKVNAGSFGVINKTKNKYVQIGQGEEYQFCKSGQSPFQAMFAKGYYKPKLLIMAFVGNASERWANSAEQAENDVRRTMADLPSNVPCIFMTTAPGYTERVVSERRRAQANIEKAFATVGKRCSFVRGYTKATVAANLGNAANFRQKPDGSVKDPYHPTETSARRWLNLIKPQLCSAIKTQLDK